MCSRDVGAARLLSAVGIALPLVLGTPAAHQSEPRPHFMCEECHEDAIQVQVDPHPFQESGASGFSPLLTEGKARVLILAQDCSQYWIDAENFGPTQNLHVWLSIDGPQDTRPVVGAQFTRPTRTWLRLFYGSTNPRARNAKKAAGAAQAAIDGVFLDPPGPKRGGRVSLGKNLSYSWRVVSATPPARMVGVNHDLYTRTISGGTVLDRIQALGHLSAGPSQGTLEVTGSTEMLPWIRAGGYPISVNTFFPVWARGTMGASTGVRLPAGGEAK